MSKKERLQLVPLGNSQDLNDLLIMGSDLTLEKLFARAPALCTKPIPPDWLPLNIDRFTITLVNQPFDKPLYRPPGLKVASRDGEDQTETGATEAASSERSTPSQVDRSQATQASDSLHPPSDHSFPKMIEESDAVQIAYAREIESAASFLRAGLSILVACDKLVVQYLWQAIARKALLSPVLLQVPVEDEGGLVPRGLRQRQLASLKALIKQLKDGHVLILPHLDLLAGGSDSNLPTESRELIELVYEESSRLMLAFADPSLGLPDVLASRFAVKLLFRGVSRTVVYPDGTEKNLGNAFITTEEAAAFENYEPLDLYKNVAGMNPVQIRHAIKYARQQAGEERRPVARLYQAIRAFKVQTSTNFEVPDVSFDDIGGYEEVKAELKRGILLMTGAYNLPNEQLRRELIPRGFIFHGPPGTGKTLFAKAIAKTLDATVQVVSGPEVTDMYVGESERKVRELFAEARRNAPAVLVFDEFDAIATTRSGREDGGSRAGNALVAQMLTEMDGFRPDVPMLVIGTTNRLDIIDEALLRPSRFKPIAIGLPMLSARRAIARVQAKHFGITISEELLEVLAASTEGMSGDEIKSLFRDACVGLHCETPPKPADAQQFGMLVGRLRQLKYQQEANKREFVFLRTPGDRPRPTGTMYLLTPPGSEELTPSTSEPDEGNGIE